jgi:tetratricopeptide (TPR) repeat protein
MQRIMIAALLLGPAAGAPAGIWSTAELQIGPLPEGNQIKPLPFSLFRDTLGDRTGLLADPAAIGPDQRISPKIMEKRKEYLGKIATLQGKVKSGSADDKDLVNLSAYLMWLDRPADAIDLLDRPAQDQYRGHFMVLSNLATAYQLAGRMERVDAYLQQALGNWPDEWPGMTKEQLQWFRKVERHQLRLALLRKVEAAKQPPGTRRAPEGVDALFGEKAPVRFVGESGQYEAGKTATAEREKLPAEAVAIVQQLLLWFPRDTRLYWLLGELLNAEGQVQEAYQVLDECVGPRRYDSAELKEHRRILQEALPQPPPLEPWTSILPDTWKLIVVGGIAVLLTAWLCYLQLRQLFRRG